MSVEAPNTLLDAVRNIMSDKSLNPKYPDGMSGGDVLTEIHAKFPGAFPLVSVLDVINELHDFYGPGKP